MDLGEAHEIYGKIKVLHIDDNELHLKILKENLVAVNTEIIVDSENDVNIALQKLKTNNYDCILLDYIMPIKDGIYVSKKIREICDVPIILYTNISNENIPEEAFFIGIDDFLKKDIEPKHYQVLNTKIINITKEHRTKKIFQEIIDSIDDSILILDDRYNIIYHNVNLINITNKTNLLGKPIIDLIEKNSKKEFIKFLNSNEKIIQSVIEDTEEISYFVEITKSKVKYIENGFYLLKLKDITGILVQNTIKTQSEERFLALANISPDAIMIGNIYGYVTYINEAYTKLTGYSWDEIIGKHILQLQVMKGRNMRPYWSLIKQVIMGKKANATTEFTYSRRDGSSGVGDFFVGIAKVGNKRELVGIVRDITERRMKEEEFQNIFKSSPEGIILLDMLGSIKGINESAKEILNVEENEVIGRKIFEAESEILESSISIKELYNKLLSERTSESLEIKIKHDMDFKWLEINTSIVKVLDENLGIQIILRDISDQKKIEWEKEIYTKNLEKMVEERTNQLLDNERMVTLAKVSSMIAHDLKGPLQVINNSLHLIKLKPEEQDKFLGYIANATKQANDLIEEMRVHSKRTPLNLDLIDLNEMIEESLIQVKVAENIDFEINSKSNYKIMVDKSKFIRVLNNIFKNAIEAMPNGGKLTVNVENGSNNTSIKISDTGIGISKEKLNYIFRPFQTTKEKGMGLGLNYCKNTIEEHGGCIEVSSELGKGTTFNILIPKIMENNNVNLVEIKDTLIT